VVKKKRGHPRKPTGARKRVADLGDGGERVEEDQNWSFGIAKTSKKQEAEISTGN
jgi:hypothetical protein